MATEFIPWIEKYRPDTFDDIVMDPSNKQILHNIINNAYFPNLLFYGPPGTGKTTTINNLIKQYYSFIPTSYQNLVISLNASDDRGVEVIRTQIHQFVTTQSVFVDGIKFVILDEADYMTKPAQHALKYLIHTYSHNIRFCLICNYISKIDNGLQHEFLKIRFNQLPIKSINSLLHHIAIQEKLNISEQNIQHIQSIYNSDIRSMINFLQSNQHIINEGIYILTDDVWKKLYNMFLYNDSSNIYSHINLMLMKYNINVFNIIKDFSNYIIKYKQHIVTPSFLNSIEDIIHNKKEDDEYYLDYFIQKMITFIYKNDLIELD